MVVEAERVELRGRGGSRKQIESRVIKKHALITLDLAVVKKDL